MNILGTIFLAIVGLLELVFAIYLFTRYEKSKSITFFALFALSVSGWVLANSFGIFIPQGIFDVIGRMSFLFSSFIFPLLYLFILEHPYPVTNVHSRFIFFTFLPSVIISLIIFFSNSIVQGFIQVSYGETIYGNLFPCFSLFIICWFLLILAEMFYKRRKLDHLHRWQMSLLLIAIVISGIFGITFTILLPSVFNIRFAYWLGPASSVIWLGFMWVIIRRKT
jgi:hypothetical protein